MRLWRVSEHVTLNGFGGTLADGRWHRQGSPIVYLAESSALALLEVFVNLAMGLVPSDYQLLRIDAADALPVEIYPAEQPPAIDRSRAWGAVWLREARTPLARVPSTVAPYSWNLLLNPLHPGAADVRATRVERWPWDHRLFR